VKHINLQLFLICQPTVQLMGKDQNQYFSGHEKLRRTAKLEVLSDGRKLTQFVFSEEKELLEVKDT